MPKHGSIILYVHGNQKTLTQLLNYETLKRHKRQFIKKGEVGGLVLVLKVGEHRKILNS